MHLLTLPFTTDKLRELDGDEAITEAGRLADEAIFAVVGQLADCILGRPAFGDNDRVAWLRAQAELSEAEQHQALRKWHLVKIRICCAADLDATGDVLNAYRYGAAWDQIAEAAGLTVEQVKDCWGADWLRRHHQLA